MTKDTLQCDILIRTYNSHSRPFYWPHPLVPSFIRPSPSSWASKDNIVSDNGPGPLTYFDEVIPNVHLYDE